MSANSEKWTAILQSHERGASSDIVPAGNTLQWSIQASSGVLALSLFIAAGLRQRTGDTVGCVFSLIGAMVCASAPILARFFTGD